MFHQLPERIVPMRLAEKGARLEGRVALRGMGRLTDLLHSAEGSAAVDLEFGFDLRGRPCVRGFVRADLRLICQRCLKPLTLHVESPVLLGLVTSLDEAERLPEDIDPLLCGPEPLVLADMVEDELILALPQVSVHPSGKCPHRRATGGTEAEIHASQDSRSSPFAVLAGLKVKD